MCMKAYLDLVMLLSSAFMCGGSEVFDLQLIYQLTHIYIYVKQCD